MKHWSLNKGEETTMSHLARCADILEYIDFYYPYFDEYIKDKAHDMIWESIILIKKYLEDLEQNDQLEH